MLNKGGETKLFFIFLIIIFLCIPVVFAGPGEDSCGVLDIEDATYELTQNIVENNETCESCITILAKNITFDCKGYTITSDYFCPGIYSNQHNTTIKNCNVSMGISSGGEEPEYGYGIALEGADNSYIFNNILNEQYIGLDLISTDNITVENNTANLNGLFGISFSSSSNNILMNNTATNNFGGIQISSSSNNTLINNIVNNEVDGIYLSSSSYNNLTNNTANSNTNAGITLAANSNNNQIINNTVNSNADEGINFQTSSYNTVQNNILNSNDDAIVFSFNSDHNFAINNNIWNSSVSIVVHESDYNLFNNNKINKTSAYGLIIQSSGSGANENADHNIFKNTNMTNIYTNTILMIDGSGSENLNNTFINFTYKTSLEEVSPNSELIRKWYYQGNVSNQNNPVDNAISSIYNVTSIPDGWMFNLTSGVDGYTNRTEIIDYINYGGTRSYYSNYTINSTNGSLFEIHVLNVSWWTEQDNFGGLILEEIKLDWPDTTPPNITINTPLNQTYNTKSITFNVTTVDKVWMDSCWYSLDGGVTNHSMIQLEEEWKAANYSMIQGSHMVNFYCNDTADNINNSESMSFFIDLVYPEVNIVYPQNTTYSTSTHDLNYTYNELNPDKCWYSIDEGATNSSLVSCGTNWTGISALECSNTWTLYINDTGGKENSSSITFTVGSINPEINITYPINNSNYTDADLDVNYTFIETNPDSCWWTNDSGVNNYSLANCGINITGQTWDEGLNTVTIYINDTVNNINSSSVVFGIDATPPYFTNLANQSIYNNESLNYDIDASDDGVGVSCFSVNDTTNFNITCAGVLANKTSLSTQIYWLNITVNDTLGNLNSSVIYVNVTIPVIPSDPSKHYIKDSSSNIVAWLGNEGNIVLKGSCFSGGSCDIPGYDSFIMGNSTDSHIAFINSTGDLCIEKGDCSDESSSCNPTRGAFIIRNSSNYNMSYIDFDGDLCLTGRLYENADL